MENKKLLKEMNRINAELFGGKPQKYEHECNVMGCRNKPVHRLYIEKFNATIYCCKKHRADYDERWVEVE